MESRILSEGKRERESEREAGNMMRKAPRGGGGAAGGGGGVVGPSLASKEPASRKASGLAQLVSALHQNAAAVVNSKTQLNGPDQVGPQPYSFPSCSFVFVWSWYLINADVE